PSRLWKERPDRPARPSTMASVRCAARRLGGSVLQRTQAAAAEEGRRFVSSRFMRSRQLSGEVSSEHAGKSPALEFELDMKMKKLEASIARLKNTPGPDASTLRLMSNGRTVQGVIDAANKLIFLCMISTAVYGLDSDKVVEGEAITKETSEDKIEK
uniref:Uncharacterized protein n=3 Tax=Triticinae TaxID=1648030 RepID=A0A453A3U1_AEGTS